MTQHLTLRSKEKQFAIIIIIIIIIIIVFKQDAPITLSGFQRGPVKIR